MHPRVHALSDPDKPTMIVVETGETVSYSQLDRRSNQGAWVLRSQGLAVDDRVAVLLENTPRLLEVSPPREPTGKPHERLIRDTYWRNAQICVPETHAAT